MRGPRRTPTSGTTGPRFISDWARYVDHLSNVLKPGGQAIIATFALDGPPRCSGLEVMRYSADTLAAELGPSFRLVETLNEDHHTPMGTVQLFSYNRFVRLCQ